MYQEVIYEVNGVEVVILELVENVEGFCINLLEEMLDK